MNVNRVNGGLGAGWAAPVDNAALAQPKVGGAADAARIAITEAKDGFLDAPNAPQSFGPGGCVPPDRKSNLVEQLIGQFLSILQKLLSMLQGQANQGGDPFPIKPTQGGGAGGAGGAAGGGPAGGAGGAGHKGGIKVDGPNGFLFKPVSDSDGKLAVLLPKEMSGKVDSVVVKDANGNVLGKGRMTGNGNGDRDHFRFDKAGAAFGQNVIVEARMKDGSVKTWNIADPSQRYD